MLKAETKKEKVGISALDVRIVISIVICCVTATLMDWLGVKFTYGEMHLEIIQKMTSAIACLLVCQENTSISKTAGINRLIITVIGGMIGVLVAILDTAVNNEWLMIAMVAFGVMLTLVLCKAAKVPYINARIGGVTFILVTCTLPQYARVYYAMFRFVSTIYGVLVVFLVTWIFEIFHSKRQGEER